MIRKNEEPLQIIILTLCVTFRDTTPTLGILTSIYGIQLKLTPDIALDKRCQLMTLSF